MTSATAGALTLRMASGIVPESLRGFPVADRRRCLLAVVILLSTVTTLPSPTAAQAPGGVHPSIATPAMPLSRRIVVTSLGGHLLVYEREVDGRFGALIYQAELEGALGMFNSIVIADLDNDQQNELYVSGSLGLRKFLYNP